MTSYGERGMVLEGKEGEGRVGGGGGDGGRGNWLYY